MLISEKGGKLVNNEKNLVAMLSSELMEELQAVKIVQMQIISLGQFFCSAEWLGNLDIWAGVVNTWLKYRKHVTLLVI